ncbi:MAG TPA: hypothetical protein VF576_08040, partial [Rubricoccaceae bacterium]
LDHLTAVVAGVVLLGALLVLQQRDRLARVEATLADAARARAENALDVVARDTDNLLPRAQSDVFLGGAYRTRVVGTADGTAEYTLATFVRDAPSGADAPAVVRYTLVPTGDTALVAGRAVPLHRLRRQTDRGAGFDAGLVVSESVADFSVAFGDAGGPLVTDGPPPPGTSHVRIRVAVAAGGAGHAAPDQRSTRATLLARAEATVRPQNLGPAR